MFIPLLDSLLSCITCKHSKALIVILPQGLLACCIAIIDEAWLGGIEGEITILVFATGIRSFFHHGSFCRLSPLRASGVAWSYYAQNLEGGRQQNLSWFFASWDTQSSPSSHLSILFFWDIILLPFQYQELTVLCRNSRPSRGRTGRRQANSTCYRLQTSGFMAE